jgi:hypothetical protein
MKAANTADAAMKGTNTADAATKALKLQMMQ